MQFSDPFSLQSSTVWRSHLEKLIQEDAVSMDEGLAKAFEASLKSEAPSNSDSGLERLGERFRDLSLIGEGATAHVYRAFDGILERWVALKCLKTLPEGHAHEVMNEARAQAQIEHPNVCRIYEVGQLEGRSFIAMQLVEGGVLAKAYKDLDETQKIRLVRDIAEGVHAAHRKGLIHLDLKPGNILVQSLENGDIHPLLSDFGMMRLETAPVSGPCPMGTPPYSSPEQIAGDFLKVDRRSDVYSLGITLYVLLSGRFPLEAESFSELLLAIRTWQPIPLTTHLPKASKDLEAILERCLAKNPQKRYPTAQALADDLQRYLDGSPVEARKLGFTARLLRKAKRQRALVAVSAVALCLTLGLGTWGLIARHQANQRAEYTQRYTNWANEIEGYVWRHYAMPLHDVSGVHEDVKQRLAKLEAELKKEGKAALGPGSAALGRGYLVLRELDKAQSHLERAWQAGFQTPETAYALGLTLAQLYEKHSYKSYENPDPESRKKREKENHDKYKAPALYYLSQSRGALLDAPEYIEGLVALYEGNPGLALEKSNRLIKRNPWFYDAHGLKAKVNELIAEKKYKDGLIDDACRFRTKVDENHINALQVARSNPHYLVSRLNNLVRIAQFRIDDVPVDYCYQETIKTIDDLLIAIPENSEYLAMVGHSLGYFATSYNLSKSTPMIPLSKSIQYLEKSIDLDPLNEYAWMVLSRIYCTRGEWNSYFGKDPFNDFTKALRCAEKSLVISKDYLPGNLMVAQALWYMALYADTPLQTQLLVWNRMLKVIEGVSLKRQNIRIYYAQFLVDFSEELLYDNKDPRVTLDQAISEIENVFKSGGNRDEALIFAARIEALRARYSKNDFNMVQYHISKAHDYLEKINKTIIENDIELWRTKAIIALVDFKISRHVSPERNKKFQFAQKCLNEMKKIEYKYPPKILKRIRSELKSLYK